MASKQIHNSTQLPLMTDEGKSVNVFDGPWNSIEAFEAWWNETTDGEAVSAGTTIGVSNGTNVDKYCWLVPEGSSGYWKRLDYIKSIIEFAGVVSDITVTLQSSSSEGNRATVFYDETSGTFVNKSGTKYYGAWKNSYNYGEIDGGRIYPYEGKLYVDITTGQVFYSTSEELTPVPGGGGIDSELLAELERLKALNIQFSGGTLRIFDSADNETKEYNLDEQVVVSYGTPSVSFGYGSITSSGGTYNPDGNNRMLISQAVFHNGDLYDTLIYRSVEDLRNALVPGDSVAFTATGDGFSVVRLTGILTVTGNTGSEARTGAVTLSFRLNGVEATATIELSQPAESVTTLYASEIIYDTVGVVGQTCTAAPKIKGSNGTTYASLTAFNQAGGETLTFSSTALYGASLDSSTGILSYNPSTVLNAFIAAADDIVDEKGRVKNPSIVVSAGNATGSHLPVFDSVITTELDATFGVHVDESSSKLVTGDTVGKTVWSFAVTADNIYCFRIAHSGTKTPCILLVSDAALVTENSVNTADVVYNSSSIYVSDYRNGSFIYKASASKYITAVLMFANTNTKIYMFDGGSNE